MAATNKTYLDLDGLTLYNTNIKNWANSANQVAYKKVGKSTDGNSLYFYKDANARVGTDTPDVTIDLGGGDSAAKFTELANKLGGTWSGNTLTLTAFSTGIDASTIVGAINEVYGDVTSLQTLVGSIPSTATANTVVGYAAEVASNEADAAETEAKSYTDTAIENLDVDEFALASVSNNVVTIKGIKETNGEIAVGTTAANNVVLEEIAYTGAAADVSVADAGDNFTGNNVETVLAELQNNINTLDNSLAAVAKSGAASDVSYSQTIGSTTVTNVDDALDALVTQTAGGVASKTVYMTDNETATTGYLKTYKIYQGSTGSVASPVASELIGTIDIPKDLVVTSGTVETVETADVPYPGAVVGDKYIDLAIANQTEHIYIPAKDLVDIYTAQQNATQVQLVIDGSNVISASIVAGSVDTTELANSAVTTAKIADDAVTADKVAIAAHTASQTAGTDGLAISVTTTDGQVSAVTGSIAANTYDAYGAAANAVAALDGSAAIASYEAGTSGTADVITIKAGITETNGVVSQGSGNDITLSTITSAEIAGLFT